MSEVEYLKINTSLQYYTQSIKIRDDIMRRPLGLRISDVQLKNELSSVYHHFVAIINNEVVSALSIKVNKKNIQICQLATLGKYRKKGIGKGLLTFAENKFHTFTSINKVMLFSRETSIDFYKKCNYVVVDNSSCEIVGLLHRKMVKTLPI